jgi:tRNA dimethylallyltransferase
MDDNHHNDSTVTGNENMLRRPLIAIVGCTGTGKNCNMINSCLAYITILYNCPGKSRLAVDLAKRFHGEIINADAMQCYRGLDIATCKVTAAEMQGVPHHLMSFLPATRQYIVKEFVRDARAAIDEIHARGRVPIVVGGTHYYVQSLLFKNTLVDVDARDGRYSDEDDKNDLKRKREAVVDAMDDTSRAEWKALDAMSMKELFDRLQQVDPLMAEKWHPNDGRKIKRSLQVISVDAFINYIIIMVLDRIYY